MSETPYAYAIGELRNEAARLRRLADVTSGDAATLSKLAQKARDCEAAAALLEAQPAPEQEEPGPCPWCDGTPTTKEAMVGHYVECPGCDARGPWKDTRAEAVATWNRHASRPEAAPAPLPVYYGGREEVAQQEPRPRETRPADGVTING